MLPAVAEQSDTATQTLAGSYASIMGSLALVAYMRDKTLITGSSFCVAEKDGKSYFLTDAHVVGDQHVVSVFLSSDPGESLVGTVVRVNRALGAALIAIQGDVRPLTLSADRLPEGQKIAIAGYPSTHVRLALAGFGLAPSVHEGIISSYPADAPWLDFDGQLELGNSGGPVFDPDTGRVYGLVTFKVGTDQTNVAIRANGLIAFLGSAGVTPDGQSIAGLESKRDVPFPTYIPLREQDQFYECDRGITLTMSIRPFAGGENGEFTVTLDGRGVDGAPHTSRSLQRHDSDNNIVLVGYFAPDGSLNRLPVPVVAVPLRPTLGTELDVPSDTGSTTRRTWSGSTSLQLPLGNYHVEVYSDALSGGRRLVTAYADKIGLLAVTYLSSNGSPVFACSLARVAPETP
jgi:hypothetical protein